VQQTNAQKEAKRAAYIRQQAHNVHAGRFA